MFVLAEPGPVTTDRLPLVLHPAVVIALKFVNPHRIVAKHLPILRAEPVIVC